MSEPETPAGEGGPEAGLRCSEHPDAAAAYGCDGCGRLLCEECIEEGHRLLTCRPCGERALPLDRRQPADVRARRAAATRDHARRYTWTEAPRYPLRGQGLYALVGGVAVYLVLLLLARLGSDNLAGMVAVSFGLVVLALAFQGLLSLFVLEIARSTAAGADELPDWPEPDLIRMLGAELLLTAMLAVSALPAAALGMLGGCLRAEVDLGAGAPLHCLLLWGIGLVPSMALWLLAFGATAVHGTPWLFFRIDLHARAAAAVRRDLAIATALHAGLISLVLLLWIVLALLPIGFLAAALGGTATLYAVVVSAHLSGAVFRRNPEVLERIYRGRNEPAPELAGRLAGPRVQERTRRTP